jgi:helicase
MAFKGLFIGIDRYISADINWLSCARRDATALHALFADTMGGDCSLLVDEQATNDGLRIAFESLSMCESDDVVVIAFSGHGTSTHELVPYDTNLKEISGTTIPLDQLADWFSKIPAKRLLLILDCCFSGGMGAGLEGGRGSTRCFIRVGQAGAVRRARTHNPYRIGTDPRGIRKSQARARSSHI